MKLQKLFTFFITFFFACIFLQSQQLYDITPTEKDGTWQPISGGTYVTAGDDAMAQVNLPFTFRIDEQAVTYVYPNTNGYLQLGYSYMSLSPTPGYYYGGGMCVAFCAGDGYERSGIYYVVTGSSPNRVITFQWNSYSNYYGQSTFLIQAQIKLYETSNKIEIIYGPQSGSVYSYTSWIYFAGRRISSYGPAYNIDPGSPSRFVKGYPNYESGYTTRFLDASDYGTRIKQGKMYIYGKSDPELVGIYPAGGEIFRVGQIYGGTDPNQHPALFIKRQAGMPSILLNYQIYGPGELSDPTTKIVYRAKDPVNSSFDVNPGNITGDSTRYNFTAGTGVCFGSGGNLDLQTNAGQFEPGEYTVEGKMIIDQVGTLTLPGKKFNIALAWDIGITKIAKPRPKFEKKYPLAPLDLIVRVNNLGLNDVSHFEVLLDIYDASGTKQGNTRTLDWDHPEAPLASGAWVEVTLPPNFVPIATGDYYLQAVVNLLDASDLLTTNNVWPRSGVGNYYFSFAKEIDVRGVEIVYPKSTDEVIVGRPINPVAKFTNQGVNDLDFDSIYFEIKYIQTNQVVFRDTLVNYVISAGSGYDTTNVRTIKNFVPPYIGEYQVCATIYSPWDSNPLSLRKVCTNFTANSGLVGNYTIGSGTGSRHFATIQDAVDALYKYGAGGHVVFELKDRGPYVLGNVMDDRPALDLTSYIHGMGPDATVTFRPSADRAVERGGNNSGVTIHVCAGNGYGIVLGQNTDPLNPFAICPNAFPSQKNKYSKSNGYFIFDGGQNKSIRFVLKTRTDVQKYTHNVFFLKQGSSNNQIKNCIFENEYKNAAGNNLTPHVFLPHLRTTGSLVEYMTDQYLSTTGYSSAIVMRTISPRDKSGGNTLYNLDTLTCNNNIISGNEISGFGYGVVDMGGGALMRIGHNQWTKYYNSNNVISNNVIKNVSRAGIWLGYTENEKVTGNRIYNVTGLGANTYLEGGNPVNYDAGGILAGGDPYGTWKGFNNIDLLISGNEISNVTSSFIAYGIKVEQSLISYPKTPEDTYFPDRAENTTVMNNLVWGMTSAYNASRVGIRIFTERVSIAATNFLNAKVPTYFTTGDKIMNNTVIMPDDEGKTTGGLACIALQHSNGGKILNNAVAMLDNYVDVRLIGLGGAPAASAIFYQGIIPGEANGLESNRNAFWQPAPYLPHEGPSAYGFVELDVDGSFIEPTTAGQYQILGYETLRQWRNWTNQDYNSVIADFTDDLEYTGTSVQYLRIKNPRPFGSVLNDRGFRLTEYLGGGTGVYNYDAFGTQRGVNGQLYDIGAEEFEGRMYLSDVEFQMISSPAAYKSGVGTFSDAEHIMTTLPIDFKVILRNSGNIFQAATKVRLEVISADAGIHYYDTVTTDIVVAQSKEVTFNIPSSIIKTYSELTGVTVPSRFDPTMKANVTPVYTFKVEVQADENNENNNGEADFRFYIRQSNGKLMVISAEYANTLVENGGTTVRTVDEIAGRLNYKALQDAFEKMKLWPRINRDIDYPGDQMDTFKIDVFDRMSWEPKSVDYRMYKYVFWSDRNDSSGSPLAINQLTRYQQWDIQEFLNAGTTNNKRNIVIASQEAVRNASFSGDAKAVKFMNETLRSVYQDDTKKGQAFGIGTNCNLKEMKGVALGKDFIQLVKETGAYYDYPTSANRVYDMFPKVGFVNLFTKGEGIAKESHVYPGSTPANLKTGVAMTTLTKNVVYIGVDWRHFGDPEAILRSVMDYYDKNGGTEIPIELADFNAKARSNRVEISWATESELNSDKFEVEKARVSEGVKESFTKIAEKAAAGKSSVKLEYGPVVDRDVVNGGTYIYRLKMVDRDGKYTYSNERMVEMQEGMWLGEAMPNPVEGIAKFEITTGDKAIELYVYDVNGREMGLKHEVKNGMLEIDMSSVMSGVYTVVLKSGEMMITRQVRVVR